jgi:FtsZ-binding cell division protein ZapB
MRNKSTIVGRSSGRPGLWARIDRGGSGPASPLRLIATLAAFLAVGTVPHFADAQEATPPQQPAPASSEAAPAAQPAATDQAAPAPAPAPEAAPAQPVLQEEPGPSTAMQIETSREQLNNWVETRRIISQEKRDWALGKEMLTERISIVENEINSLKEKIKEAQANITEADKKRTALVEENEKLKLSSAAMLDQVAKLEGRTLALIKRVPDPIRDRVKPLSQRIPAPGSETKSSLSERFQNVIGVLNEINKFNRDVTTVSEVRQLPDGSSAEVTTMYLGIGQGYYVGANNTIAGRGTATADGWVWTPMNESAQLIAQAVAINKNEQVASFVKLPIEIKKP